VLYIIDDRTDEKFHFPDRCSKDVISYFVEWSIKLIPKQNLYDVRSIRVYAKECYAYLHKLCICGRGEMDLSIAPQFLLRFYLAQTQYTHSSRRYSIDQAQSMNGFGPKLRRNCINSTGIRQHCVRKCDFPFEKFEIHF
jgi:hypothetical protein